MRGDAAAAHATLGEAADIARRFADRDLASIACHGRGRALIRLGRVAEGGLLLDEAMAAVVAGDVSALVAGDVYCSVLGGCHEIFDLRRAYEWTASLAQWCEAQPGLVRYRGECLYYRAEVLQLLGQWREAARDAESACELLRSRPTAGAAFYRRGEIHRLRGELVEAEQAYTAAHERGRKPQPGLSLLRLAEGRAADAAASIRSALLDTQTQVGRARMLPAAVEILLAAGDVAAAQAAAAELSEIAAAFAAPLLTAAAAHAAGAVLLAEGNVEAASTSLRQARGMWRELQTPYEEAQTCLLLAAVCETRSDQDGRRLETETARRIFTQLEADYWLERIAAQPRRARHQRAGPLSGREAQVLRLVAAGMTNRGIADALFISEKTVARHVSNIFDKLGVSNRSAATAWAFKHNLA
jgi:DNA-binding CsgD family transcriptional regulator